MNPVHPILILAVIVLSFGSTPTESAPPARSETETAIEDNFQVSWSEIAYNKRLALRNPAVSKKQRRESSETLSLSCEIQIRDPKCVLGVCRKPIIEEVTYGTSQTVEFSPYSSGSDDLEYDFLRYDERYVKTRPKWRNAVRSALGLPPRVISRPKWFKELESRRMQIELDAGVGKQPDKQIARVKGYFYALIAESLAYVEVPFKQSDDWVRLTPNMEIRVRRASCRDSQYTLSVAERPEPAGSALALHAHSYLPHQLVVARYLVGPDNKPIHHPLAIRGLPDPLNDRGEAARGNGVVQIEKIRYVIAVNLSHHKIPFVVEDIPLPKP